MKQLAIRTPSRSADHAIEGACLAAIAWLILSALGFGVGGALALVLAFVVVVALIPGPDPAKGTGAARDVDAAHAHGPHPALEAWIRARRRRGLLGSSSAALADAARCELRIDVTAEEICAAIERADADQVLANARRKAVA